MAVKPRQLAFDLPVDPRYGIDDFLVSPSNEEAYATIERWPSWPDPVLCLTGGEGAGKSHLAAIWSQFARAWIVDAASLRGDDVPHLASSAALVVEDADRGVDEAALFHLINAMRARGGWLLVTARTPPDGWGLRVPDLLSRLRMAPLARLAAPDDALLRALLVKLFLDRQLVVDTALVDYLATRLERSAGAARAAVEAIDRLALEGGRRVTRAVAAAALTLSQEADADAPAAEGARPSEAARLTAHVPPPFATEDLERDLFSSDRKSVV